VKQLFRIVNEPAVKPIQPVLLLRVGQRHLSFAIADLATKRITELVCYTSESIDENTLTEWLNTETFAPNDFYQVAVSFDFPQSILIPSAQYRQEEGSAILKSVYVLNGASVIIAESIPEWQLYNTHAVPKDIFDWVTNKFSSANYKNGYSVDIRSVEAANPGGTMMIDFKTDEFSILVTKEGRFLLSQTFEYSTPEDVIYFLLKIVQQYSLSQQDVQLQLSGFIDKQSSLYKELYQYFIEISFREGDWSLPASEYPAHFFTSLNDLGVCVS
jgi:Protein of unknown function (DUF3822)